MDDPLFPDELVDVPPIARARAVDRAVRDIRTPPHSNEAEQAVLGGIMLENQVWFDVADIVSAADFYSPQHQRIFTALNVLAEGNQPLDAVTVCDQLRGTGSLEDAGGLAYIADLVENTPAADNIKAYAGIVRERSTQRALIAAGQAIANAAFDPKGRDSADLLDAAEQEVFRIAERRQRAGGPEPVLPMLTRAVARIERLYETRDPITGLSTGFRDLDVKTAGLQPQDLVIIAGRPSMGKTSFAMNIVEHALMDPAPGAVLVFSMEMPADGLLLRMLSSLGRIDQSRMRIGDMKDEDWPRFTSAVAMLKDKPLLIDETPALTPNELRTRARRVAREYKGIKLIVVDYLQLMRTAERQDNRTAEISEISRSMKALAKDIGCPVIALSQLNRSLEQRTDKRPVMADLRESGAIEQDADLILFIYRDEVYNRDSPAAGTAEIIIGKQRNGPIGVLKVAFIGHLTRFENLAEDRYNHM